MSGATLDLCWGHPLQSRQMRTLHAGATGDRPHVSWWFYPPLPRNNHLAPETPNGRSATPFVSSDAVECGRFAIKLELAADAGLQCFGRGDAAARGFQCHDRVAGRHVTALNAALLPFSISFFAQSRGF